MGQAVCVQLVRLRLPAVEAPEQAIQEGLEVDRLGIPSQDHTD